MSGVDRGGGALLFTFGCGGSGKLGHGGQQDELVPRLIEALAGKTVIGASSGRGDTVVPLDKDTMAAGPRRART